MSAPSNRSEEIRRRVAAKWQELAGITNDVYDQWPCPGSPGHAAMAQFALELKRQALRSVRELVTGPEHRCCDKRAMRSNRLHLCRCAERAAPSGSIEKARALVAWLWAELGRITRFARKHWPWRNSQGHVALAQFELEAERARRASGEKGGRA
jgi:hypothetical protein